MNFFYTVSEGNIFLSSSTDQTYQWDIDFYPRGFRYGKAQLINVNNIINYHNTNSLDIPEYISKTVRLSVKLKSDLREDQKFMVSKTSHPHHPIEFHSKFARFPSSGGRFDNRRSK